MSVIDTPRGDLRRAKLASIAAQQDEYEELLPYLTYQERLELDQLLAGVYLPIWEPFEGPQTEALLCQADELFYGGAAGGGKTDLLLGTSLTSHWRSIIFRREYAELKGIRERADELFDDIGRFNGQSELWRITEGQFKGVRIEFGACQHEGDERKFQGRPHDLKAFDEIPEFTEAQYRFLTTWNRSARLGQRSRVIAAGNPPTTAEGQWVVKYWAPWIDPRHPNPAKQGELRWFLSVPAGITSLVNTLTGEPHTFVEGGGDIELTGKVNYVCTYDNGETELLEPKSRTFIRARVEDNPRLMETGYRRTLQGLPEPLRSRMLRGDFNVGVEDAEWQVIPTDWVLQAQARWAPSFEDFLIKQASQRALPNADQTSVLGTSPEQASEELLRPSSLNTERPARDRDHAGASPGKALKSEPELPKSLLGRGAVNATAITQARTDIKYNKPLPDGHEQFRSRRELAQKEGAIGVDVSRGGKDNSILAERLENWFAELVVISGRQTKDGVEIVRNLIELGFNTRRIHMDVSGVGASPVDIGKMYEMLIIPMVGSERSHASDRTGKLRFCNMRSEWHWKMREALDPALGDNIALPPDPELLADLTSPLWSLTPRGILVESKEHIKARLGRSPDKGDAVVMAHAEPYVVAEGYLNYMREQVKDAQEADQANRARTGSPSRRGLGT